MTLTNYVATKDLFQALIRAKRGIRTTACVDLPSVATPRIEASSLPEAAQSAHPSLAHCA